jgi:hypothetical protein
MSRRRVYSEVGVAKYARQRSKFFHVAIPSSKGLALPGHDTADFARELVLGPSQSAHRGKLAISVIHAVGEAHMPRSPVVVGQRSNDNRHTCERLNVLAA